MDSEVQAQRLELPISEVEVFRQMALVTRRGDFGASDQADVLTLHLSDLPFGLIDSSLRVALSDGRYRLREVRTVLDVQIPEAHPRHALSRQLRAVGRELDALDQRIAFVRLQIEKLSALQPKLPKEPDRAEHKRFTSDDPVAGWLALFSLRDQRVPALSEQLAELERTREEILDRQRDLQNRFQRLSTQEREAIGIKKCVHVVLVQGGGEADAAGGQIALSYLIRGAFWVPSYELRINPELSQGQLKMHALLAQCTGEDWSRVSVRLSTADLERKSELPKLGAFRIGRAVADERPKAWRPLPDDLDELFSDYQRFADKTTGWPDELVAVVGDEDFDDDDTIVSDHHSAEVMVGEGALADTLDDEYCAEPMPARMSAPMMPAPGSAPHVGSPVGSAAPMSASAMSMQKDAPKRARSMPLKRAAKAELQMDFGAAVTEPMEPPAWYDKADDSRFAPRPPLEPDGAALGFAAIAMKSVDDANRGRLVPLSAVEQLPEALRTDTVLAAYDRKLQELYEQTLPLRNLPLPTHSKRVEQSAGHYAYRYQSTAKASLPSDGELHRLPVLGQDVEVEVFYATVPRQEQAVYRQARLKNPLSQPLLAGPMDVFVGNDYLATTPLDTAPAGALLEPSLGVEPRIKVARNVVHRQRDAGFIASKTVYEDEIHIELRNGLEKSASVRVLELIPYTKEKKLDVELLEEQPPAKPYSQQERGAPVKGGRCFELRIPAGGEARCSLHYSMSLPEKNEIIGGGRRA
jgi:hypothetical protein